MGKQYSKMFENELTFAKDDDKKVYAKVTEQFDKYFEAKKLVKSYITQFQIRKQLANETVAEYITELRRLAKLCDFGAQENKMMAVQISNGVRDEQLKKKLWDEDLTLEQIIEICQTHELRAESAGLYSKSKEIKLTQFSVAEDDHQVTVEGSEIEAHLMHLPASHQTGDVDEDNTAVANLLVVCQDFHMDKHNGKHHALHA